MFSVVGLQALIVALVLSICIDFTLSAVTVEFNAATSLSTEPVSGNQTIQVKLKRTGSDAELMSPTTVFLENSGTATSSIDYQPTSENFEVTFAINATDADFEITLKADNYAENYETIILRLETPPPVNVNYGTNSTHTITLKDDGQDNTFYISNVSAVSLNEDTKQQIVITIKRFNIGNTTVEASVNLTLEFVPPASSADCNGQASQTIKFDANVLEKTNVQVCTVVDDKLVEGAESFKAKLDVTGLTGSVSVDPSRSEKTYTIVSDDVTFSCQAVTPLSEAAGTANVVVTRTGAIDRFADSIRCYTRDGSSVQPSDYTPKSTVLSFARNDSSEQFPIPIINDKVVEEDETFYTTCFATTNLQRVNVDSSCVNRAVKVFNDDTYIFFCPSTQTSVREDDGPYKVELCRVGVLSATHTVQLCWTTEGNPFPSITAGCKNITFSASNTTKTEDIPIQDDSKGETENKNFTISMTTTDVRVTFNGSTSYDVTLQDNDNTFYLESTTTITANENSGAVKVKVKRDGQLSVQSTVKLSLVFGNNAESADCTGPNPQNITFDANKAEKEVTACTIADDSLVEPDETFTIKIEGVATSNVRSASTERTVKIISDDVSITCSSVTQKEGDGAAEMAITRTGATALNHTITCVTQDGTALQPSDYTQTSESVSFQTNQVSKNFSVAIKNDNIPEDDEKLTVNCTTSDVRVNLISCSGQSINIDNDDTYIFFCPSPQTSIREDAGPYKVELCRVGVLSATHTVKLCWTTEGNPFPSITAGCKNITFSASNTTKSEDIPIQDDNKGETENKNFTISMTTTDVRVTFNGSTSYDVTLQDNDNTFYLESTTTITANENSGAVKVKIKRDGQLSVQSTVKLSLVFGNNAESADCTGQNPQNITFDANKAEKEVTACTIADDSLVEPDETFTIKIEGVAPSNVRSGSTVRTVKIISDDVDVTCSNVNVKEGDGPAVMGISRTGATQLHHIVTCTTSDGTATKPSDYSQKSESVAFLSGQTRKNFQVLLPNDNIPEGNKTFTVACTTSDSRVNLISCSSASIDIVNDDTYIYFCPPYSKYIREAAGPYTVALCRVGVLQASHTVEMCWTSDANSQAHDFPSITPGCVNITFSPSETRKEYNINITDDSWGEQEFKKFNIMKKTNDNRITFNDTTSYNVTLHDEDNSFCVSKTFKVHEQTDRQLNVTIRRIGAISTANTSIKLKVVPGKAVATEDYQSFAEKDLTYNINDVEKMVTINIVNDKLVEDEQPFQVLLVGRNGSTVIPDCKASTVTIVSNDVNVFCTSNVGIQEAFEDQSPVLVVFTREGSTQYNHTIRVRSVSGTAQSSSDFYPIDKVLTFLSGQRRIEMNVTYKTDLIVEQDESFHIAVTSSDNRVNIICPEIDFKIKNDDTFVRCANHTVSVSEDKKTVSFVLKREGVVNKETPIWYSTLDGTAYKKSDYTPVDKRSATFAPGQVYMTLSVDIVDDDVHEEDENFGIKIGTNAVNTLTTLSLCTNITIKDDDLKRMSEQQAQELLNKRKTNVVIFSVAIGLVVVLIVVVLFFIFVIYKLLHHPKMNQKQGRTAEMSINHRETTLSTI